MEERGNKTIICSVFFLDIVEYSKKSVSGQISLKERFNAFLSIAIRDVPVNDRIILDTGDGAAISFLGDISDALHAALSMRSSLLNEGVRMEPPLLVRMGVNLGPVRLVKDINGQPNIVGDGINVAQRVMGFADPGQILVSRSYYDAVSRLSQEYAGMFHYQGSRTDKHVREHEVYAIGYPGDFTSTQRSLTKNSGSEQAGFVGKVAGYWDVFVETLNRWEHLAIDAFRRASNVQRVAVIGMASAVLITTITLLVKLAHRPVVQKVPAAVVDTNIEQAKTEKLSGAASQVANAAPVAKVESPAKGQKHAAKEQQSSAKEQKVQGVKKSSRVRTLAETTGGPAVLTLAILPWGEVYLDGRPQGVSPPLMELQVIAGKHTIEIRNTKFPVYKQAIVVKPGAKIKIKHSFH